MSSYTTAINFSVVILLVLGIWGSLGALIPYLLSDYSKQFKEYLVSYLLITYAVSTVVSWGYIEQPEISEAAPVRAMLPQLIVLWDFAAWIPIEVTGVLLLAIILLVILVRERGLTI